MNGDRGEGFEGDFAACRRIKGLLADCNVRFPDCLVLTSPRVSSEDEAVVTPRTKKSSARLEPTSGRASSPPVEQIPLEAFASLRLMWYGIATNRASRRDCSTEELWPIARRRPPSNAWCRVFVRRGAGDGGMDCSSTARVTPKGSARL